MIATKKPFYEEFARFYERPTREGLRELLRNNVGERKHIDFKEQWPIGPRLARHVLGFGNSGGGCLVVGVRETTESTLEPCGVTEVLDKTKVLNSVKNFLPNSVIDGLELLDFAYDAAEYPTLIGRKFQVLLLADDPEHIPLLAKIDGDGIRANAVYVRRGAATEEATHEELQEIINRRVATGHSTQAELDLEVHLEQLRMLYGSIEREYTKVVDSYGNLFRQNLLSMAYGGRTERVKNQAYPTESFDQFVARMIEAKKRVIESELGVRSGQ